MGAPASGIGSAIVKVVGVADGVAQVPAAKAAVELSGANAHNNSLGGVEVINKHDDKVSAAIIAVAVTMILDNFTTNVARFF
jgi:tetrahydromethanopterin S-methyltransferase subunit D